MKAQSGCHVYGKMVKRKPTEEERKYYEKIYQKEKVKYERDLKAGGIDEVGQYTRLSDRWLNGK